jgi:hypothetical protein
MKRVKILAVIVLAGALIGLVTSIERTARPITQRQPGAATAAQTPPEGGPEAGHGPGDGHNH